MSTTPVKQDKRLWITAGAIALVLALVALGKTPSDGVLAYVAGLVTFYSGQSQWGQTKRTLGPGK